MSGIRSNTQHADLEAIEKASDARLAEIDVDATAKALGRIACQCGDYCRYRLTAEKKWLQRVQRRAKKPPDECGVENILAQLTGSTPPDVGTQRAQQLLEMDKRQGEGVGRI